MAVKLFTSRVITQAYLQRYGRETARVHAWRKRRVQICSDHGTWRENGKGYTVANAPNAWILPFEQALEETAGLGPEKRVKFLLAPGEPDITI